MAKLAFFAAAWVQGLASRTEGASMLQVSEHIQVDANRLEYLNNVKQQILAIAANGVPAATISVLDSVSGMLTTQVLPAILTERNLEEANHDSVHAQFDTATGDYDTAIGAATTFLNDDVGAAQTAHSNCRGPGAGSESDAHTNKVTCDGEQGLAQGNYDSDEGAVLGLSQADGICVAETFAWRSQTENDDATLTAYQRAATEYAAAIGEVIATRGLLDDKIAECAGLDGVYNDKKDTCDAAQLTFETKSCSYTGKVDAAVSAYNTRYDEVKAEFEGLWTGWDASSVNRETQCKLVKTLVCYIDGLKANDDSAPLTASVEACDAGRDAHNCDDVTFAHSATPARGATAASPTSPCDGDFVYMATWPTGTAAADCNAC